MRFSDSYKWYSTCKQRKIKFCVWWCHNNIIHCNYSDIIHWWHSGTSSIFILLYILLYWHNVTHCYILTYCYIVHWNIWVCDVIYCYTIMTSHTSMCCDGIATPQLCNKMMTLLHHVYVTHSAGLWCHLSLLLMSECDITAIAYWCYILMIFVMSW